MYQILNSVHIRRETLFVFKLHLDKRIRNVAIFLSIKLTVGKLQTVSCNLWVVFFHLKSKEREISFKILFKCLFVIESIFVFIQYLQYSLNSTDYDTCVCVFYVFLTPTGIYLINWNLFIKFAIFICI